MRTEDCLHISLLHDYLKSPCHPSWTFELKEPITGSKFTNCTSFYKWVNGRIARALVSNHREKGQEPRFSPYGYFSISHSFLFVVKKGSRNWPAFPISGWKLSPPPPPPLRSPNE